MALGGDRVVSPAGAGELNGRLRAHGLEVYDPELEMFTLGGGGAHCLGQALRRERVR
jgi:N-dimethylarginine dimethylaminohydrolase